MFINLCMEHRYCFYLLLPKFILREYMAYQFFDDVAIADVAFEATGKTLGELFESAALATTNTMVKDLSTVKKKEKRTVKLSQKELDRLLHDFMQEIIFLKDAEMLLFSSYDIVIEETAGGFELTATCEGERLDMGRHELLVDVKAVSWHMFKIEHAAGSWKAFIILDV